MTEDSIDKTADDFAQPGSVCCGQGSRIGNQRREKVVIVGEFHQLTESVAGARHHFRNENRHVASVGVATGLKFVRQTR